MPSPPTCSASAVHRPARYVGNADTGNVKAAMTPPAPPHAATSETEYIRFECSRMLLACCVLCMLEKGGVVKTRGKIEKVC